MRSLFGKDEQWSYFAIMIKIIVYVLLALLHFQEALVNQNVVCQYKLQITSKKLRSY